MSRERQGSTKTLLISRLGVTAANLFTVENYATDGQCIPNWYCARTYAGRERGLRIALEQLGIETYLPLFTQRKTRTVTRYIPATRQYKAVLEPIDSNSALFPGYLFARLGDYDWAAVKTRLGVVVRPQWVQFGDGPVIVTPEFMQTIRDWQEVAATIKPHAYKKNQAVEILSGPFAGFTGLFSHDADERIMVLVTMLGRQPLVAFEQNEIQPLTY